MSRIGSAPIDIPAGVTITIDGGMVSVNGPKGTLEMPFRNEVTIEQVENEAKPLVGSHNQIIVKRKKEDKVSKSLHGLYRSNLFNMVKGVTDGWTKNLEMVGVGYRVQGGGDTLTLSVGFSHQVTVKAPEGISFTASDNTKISVTGIDKILVGQVAANIRDVKPPEVYKGKGIRYAGEVVRRKPGKAGKAVGGAK